MSTSLAAQSSTPFAQGELSARVEELGQPALTVLGAAGLGLVVAALFLYSRNPEERRRGFAQTLVLVSPLIAMVTMAVGENVAAAFTLVGTLAIVRFRTAVRDTRDMAYVIFAVAVGMAMGTQNHAVAVAGTSVIAAVVFGLRQVERVAATKRGSMASVRLIISPPDADASVYREVLLRFASGYAVVKSGINRNTKQMEVRLSVGGTDPNRSPELLAALLEVPEIVRAFYAADDEF